MKKTLVITFAVALLSSCVSQTKYDDALARIAELESEIDELKNGEERLTNLFNSSIAKGDYLSADKYYSALMSKHPEAPAVTELKKNNAKAFNRIQVVKDSVAKVKRDSIRLANINDIGGWQIGYYVDDFGERTGEHFIYKKIFGKFSNSATAGSDLLVKVKVYSWNGRPSIDIECDEYANGVNDESYCGHSWKVICKETKKRYRGYYGSLNELDEEGNSIGEGISLNELFAQEKEFEFTAYHEYNTTYKYTIDTKGYQNALLKSGVISIDDIE